MPTKLRFRLFFGLFVLESRDVDPAQGLRRLFTLRDSLELTINERAMAYGRGEHPKHRLTDYHRFFIDRLDRRARILDVGCGYGAVARSVAQALPDSIVVGIDNDARRMAQAQSSAKPPNLSFVAGDATRDLPPGSWDSVILSNVLEHIPEREQFLAMLRNATGARQFLIRIPLFERDWQMPLRRELGSNYFSDPDHKIEHTISEFREEAGAAGLKIIELQTLWGEIWADCRCAGADE